MLNPSTKREWRRRATKLFRGGLSTIGGLLPRETKISLARRSTKLGYLLDGDGDFIFPEYLGDLQVNINAKYSTERVMLTGHYEKDLDWTIQNHVKPGDVCLDIGANIGAVTLMLAKSVGKSGRVWAFEPGPVFFNRLNANLALNPVIKKRVETFNLGLSDQAGNLHWAEDPDFPGNAFLFGERGTNVKVVTLDDFLGEKLARLDFIKIDVEGMEAEVLRGAKAAIQKFRPKIFFETILTFETYRNAPVIKMSADFLIGLGYRLFQVTDGGRLVPVTYPNFGPNTLALHCP